MKEEDLPPFPFELQEVWDFFTRLARRRQCGMAPNPISYQEVDAFCRRCLVELSAWEVDLIMRLDDVFLRSPDKPDKADDKRPEFEPAPIEVKPTDRAGMKSLFRGLAARRAAQTD